MRKIRPENVWSVESRNPWIRGGGGAAAAPDVHESVVGARPKFPKCGVAKIDISRENKNPKIWCGEIVERPRRRSEMVSAASRGAGKMVNWLLSGRKSAGASVSMANGVCASARVSCGRQWLAAGLHLRSPSAARLSMKSGKCVRSRERGRKRVRFAVIGCAKALGARGRARFC